MKFAIVAPSQVPYVQGGAERLWRGLRQAIESEGHLCEIFNIPSRDCSFWDVIDGYKKFYDLNFDHFDVLVTGKNPAWMVRHPNHYVYMLHPLRGVYDTYHLFGLGDEIVSDNLLIQSISVACDRGIDTSDLFAMLSELRDQCPNAAEAALPSPLLRKVLHRFDANAFKSVRRVSAISKTVANRAEYFHGRKGIKAFYPVSPVVGNASGPGKHYLTYSRLDGPKRIDLIIEAYRKARVDRPLLIVGEGPEEDKLHKLSAGVDAIQFLGRVDDARLAELLSDAHAVVFTPLMEDYGYVTAEALASGRPVITVTDSGGPTEFIKDGQNGWISEPDSEQVATSFRRAEELTNWSKMSTACKRSAAKISWTPLIADIVDSARVGGTGAGSRRGAPRRKKILSLSTYPVLPPQGGGQARVFYMNRGLSEQHDVQVVCLVDGSRPASQRTVSDSFEVHEVPSSAEFSEFDWSYYQRSGIPTTDVAFASAFALNHEYLEKCRQLAKDVDVIVAEQCFTFPLAQSLGSDAPIVYNSQNVEIDLKEQMFGPSDVREELIKWTREAELSALSEAALTIYCSQSDQRRAQEVYGLNKNGSLAAVVENGTDTASIGYKPLSERRSIRSLLGVPKGFCLFLGSWHEPNIEACRDLFSIATQLPDVQFCVAGTVGEYFHGNAVAVPENVLLLGKVSEAERLALVQGASCALNPMSAGSGTNIKMLDYLAAGLPVLTTPTGARGLEEIRDLFEIAELEDFHLVIPQLMERSPSIIARQKIAERYDWTVLGKAYSDHLAEVLTS